MATLAGAQAQSNAPFINPTKPTPEQMALAAARGLYTGQVLNFGESVRVSEMTDAPSGIVRKRLASDPYYDTINSSNRRPMRIADKSMEGKPDGALWSEQTRAPIRNLPNPATVQFDGISLTDTSAIGQGFLPPDTTGAVGPNHYVQAVNSAFRVWDRAGTALTATIPFSTLFGTLTGSCRTSNDGDPVVLYDQLADRWLISQFCTLADPNNHQLIAISKTPDPTGAYYLYDFQMPNNKFNDYPKFGHRWLPARDCCCGYLQRHRCAGHLYRDRVPSGLRFGHLGQPGDCQWRRRYLLRMPVANPDRQFGATGRRVG